MRGDLRVAALAQPAKEAVGLRADEGIAFGMSDDRGEAGELEFVEGLVERGGDGEVGKLDEEVVFLVEGEAGRVVADLLKIFEAEMEIASRSENEPAIEGVLNLISALFYQFGNKSMGRMGVGRADHVGNAIGDGHFRHGESEFEGVWAIVKAWKDVAVNVDHVFEEDSAGGKG